MESAVQADMNPVITQAKGQTATVQGDSGGLERDAHKASDVPPFKRKLHSLFIQCRPDLVTRF